VSRILGILLRRGRVRPFGVRLTFGGLLFCIGTVLIGLAAIDAEINLLLIVFGLCVGGLVIGGVTGWRGLRAVRVERAAPQSLMAGQPFEIRYTLVNRSRWAVARNLHIRDQFVDDGPLSPIETFVPTLRPGQKLTLSVPGMARRRGRVGLKTIVVRSGYPFGIFNKIARFASDEEVVVFPAVGRLLSDVQTVARALDATTGGATGSNAIGDEEYYGVREYRLGDNPRRIHWRRSARTGQLMIREMTRSADRQMWCVVNTLVDTSDGESRERLELAISAAATVICGGLERGIKIGLICNGDPLVVLPPAGGRAHRPRLLRELALREVNQRDRLRQHLEGQNWPARWRGPCLVFGARDHHDLHATAALLESSLGPATIFIPGQVAFRSLFAFEADVAGSALLPGRRAADAVSPAA